MKISSILFLSLSLLISMPMISNAVDYTVTTKKSTQSKTTRDSKNTNSQKKETMPVEKNEKNEQNDRNEQNDDQQQNDHLEQTDDKKSEQKVTVETPKETKATEITLEKSKPSRWPSIPNPWKLSIEKMGLLVTSVAGYKFIQNHPGLASFLTTHNKGISTAVVLTAIGAGLIGAYKLYNALAKEDKEDEENFYGFFDYENAEDTPNYNEKN